MLFAVAVGVGISSRTAHALPEDTASCSSSHLHEVNAGDTWFGLANEVEIDVDVLLAANDADLATIIHPGDRVCVPAGPAPPAQPQPGDRSCVGGGTAAYTVAPDDSWFLIAARSKVTMRSLLAANGATASTPLHPGDALCLPPGAELRPPTARTVTLGALPVRGPCSFGDSWNAPRGAGRRHEGTDIFASSGQRVYAVADGVLTKRAWDQPGLRAGNAWWLTTADGTYFFYAHLLDFAPGLKPGSNVKAGDVIGFVGSTGLSAGPHLHFEVHPGGGPPINPFPLLRDLRACKTGT